MQTLVIMALKVESQGLFEAAGFNPFYCGVGSTKATHSLTNLIHQHKPKKILNLGTAGSHHFQIGHLVECTSFVQRQSEPLEKASEIIHCETLTDLPKAICGSADFIETKTALTKCDIFDMEAYSLASVCKKMHIPFHSIKYVTDSSNHDVVTDWKKNLIPAANAFLTQLKVMKI